MDSEKNLKSSTVVDTTTMPSTDISTVHGAAEGLSAAREVYYQLRSYQDECRRRLREESDRLGQRTFEAGGYKVEVASADTSIDVVYDVQLLWDGLEAAGLPLERLSEMITYEPHVSGTIVRQIRKNPAYAEVIDRAILSVSPKARSVKVK